MKELFSAKRRNLLANGLMAAFSLAFSAALVGDIIWKTSLKVKLILFMMLFIILATAWLICPASDETEKNESK